MKTLRLYQTGAADAADTAFALGASSALIVMATGLGKTVISAEKARRVLLKNPTANILFLAHRRDILRQARKEFIEMCGDLATTGIISSEEVENPDAQVLFITFQSMEGRREQYAPDHFSLIIVDEAHHGYAETYHATLRYFMPKELFGMTATEERNDGLDIRDIFGNPVFEYPLARGIADGWLAEIMYHLLTDNIDLVQLRKHIKAIEGGDRKVTKKYLDTNVFLEERMDRQVEIIRERQQGGKCTVIFCRNAEDLRAFHKQMPEAIPYYSDVDADERVRILDGLRSGTVQTVLVIDMFNEGIDVPDLELLVFRRATDSMMMWLQQLGRGTRLTPRKRHIEVLDFVANCDRILAVQELGLAVTRWGGGGGMQPPIHVPGPGWGIQFTSEVMDIIRILERLQADLYPTLAEAMTAVQHLNPVPATFDKYKLLYSKDHRLPSSPHIRYADQGWVSWPHFLGTEWYTYEEARVAVQRMNPVPKDGPQYRATYRKDSKLPSAPQQTYAGRGWVGWSHFLGTDPYGTIQEATAGAQKIGLASRRDYHARYKADPRLPYSPDKVYAADWKGWKRFLNIHPYDTYEEAAVAARKLATTHEEYADRYKQDPRLVSHPYKFYEGSGWVSWPVFLGTTLYATYEEAAKAARGLGIKTGPEYDTRRTEDPRLPATPSSFYADRGWVSWPHYLDTDFYSYAEAEAVVRRLGIQSQPEYKRRYKEDPKLPSNPNTTYAGRGWEGTVKFFGTEHLPRRQQRRGEED